MIQSQPKVVNCVSVDSPVAVALVITNYRQQCVLEAWEVTVLLTQGYLDTYDTNLNDIRITIDPSSPVAAKLEKLGKIHDN